MSAHERAQLVDVMRDGLSQPSEANVEQLWLHKVERRAAATDQGTVELVTAEKLETQVQALLK